MAGHRGDAPRVRWSNSLIVRIIALCAVLVLCLLGAVYFLTGHYYQQVVRSMEEQAAAIANRAEVVLEERLGDDIEIADLLEDEEIAEVGVPISIRPVEEIGSPDTLAPRVGDEGYYFEAKHTFELTNGALVELTFRLDPDPQTELIRAFKNRNLLALSGVFLITLGLMVYLIDQALRPLKKLSDSCADISEGNLRNVEAHGTAGEIVALEETFNRMVESLREKETVEANLRQAQRLSAIGNLAAGVAHDVRNPLNAIKLLSSQALDEVPEGEAPAKQLRTIREEVDRLEDIVSGFLSLAKEEELQKALHHLDPLLEECVGMVEQEAERREVRLAQELRAGDTALTLDSRKLTRAIINVLINALEACPSGGRVRLFSRVLDDTCEIEVRDDGPGMPKEVLERAFEPYFTTKPTGTGLGLAITRGIVEEHGGTIRISGGEGQGCQVLITLPLSVVPKQI